jgi:hypothetical protein
MPYIVGEHGPELRTFGSPGSIVPMSDIGGASYVIDARGAELGVENRIAAVISQAHASAIKTSVQVNHERAQRVPTQRR